MGAGVVNTHSCERSINNTEHLGSNDANAPAGLAGPVGLFTSGAVS